VGAGLSGGVLLGPAIVFAVANINPPTVGQSNADERAAMDQAQHDREQQNGGVDPQAPQVSTSGAGSGQKGGKPYDDTTENDARIAKGKPPIGKDSHPVELHSPEQTHKDQLQEMTRSDHRGKGNFKKNHTNTGQQRSVVPKNQRAKDRRAHWKKVHEDKTKK
jgi:A nuclease of the HNH/ENDO VII superfamily with conserved LHH